MLKYLVFILYLFLAIGCQSTFDIYAKNRGNDFLDMFKAKVGVGIGLHADMEATDMAHLGAGASSILFDIGVNRRYVGRGHETNINFPVPQIMPDLMEDRWKNRREDSKGDEAIPVPAFLVTHYHREDKCHLFAFLSNLFGSGLSEYDKAGYEMDLCCILPVIAGENAFKREQVEYIEPPMHTMGTNPLDFLSQYPIEEVKSKPVHLLFDVETGATLGIFGARAGFSPGEFLDFILGIFGIDFVGDDDNGKGPQMLILPEFKSK